VRENDDMRLLIVDDIPTNRKLLRATLEAEGNAILEAADGVEAIEILAHEKVDAVISDILMPRMDGYRLCHDIRKNERLCDLPIIIYTATYTSSDDEKLAFDVGADKYLTKPAPIHAILTAVHEAIAMQHTAPRPEVMQEGEVLKEYSDRLVIKLEEKNSELQQQLRLAELSMDVNSALSQGKTLRAILQRCCEAFVQHLDATLARIWTYDEQEKVFKLEASAGIYTDIDGIDSRVPVEQFKVGLISEGRMPHVTNAFIGDPRIPEQEWARRERFAAFAGYHLIVGGAVVGVVAVFARNPLGQATLHILPSIVNAIALGIERQKSAEAVQQLSEQRRLALEAGKLGAWEYRLDSGQIFWDERCRHMFGVPAGDQIEYDAAIAMIQRDYRKAIREAVKQAIAPFNDGTYHREFPVVWSDDSVHWVESYGQAYFEGHGDQRRAVRLVGVNQEITERKGIERALEDNIKELARSNNELQQFAYVASHDLQEPLRAVASFTKLLGQRYSGRLDQDADDFIGFAIDGATRMQRLIEDLLIYSRVGTRGKAFEAADCNDVLRRAMENLQIASQESGAIVSHDELPTVMGDPLQLVQLFQNLVGNAIKFRFEKPPQIHISAALKETHWVFSVRDNGIGIDPSFADQIFVIFQRLRVREEYAGTGIGLAICKKIVERHSGRIWVESEPGKGATFFFTIQAIHP
jgi:signal transduction histidine kinase/CheY-like chemotaxis protein